MKIVPLAAACILISTAPAFAVTSTEAPPVKITSCVVQRDDTKSNSLPGPAYTNGVTGVAVNTTTKTIKDIQVSGVYNGVTVTDTIEGPFAPGSTTTIHKTHIQMVYTGPDADCVLNHVTFADGTTWQMPIPPMKP
jgi:hypothetical protein